MRIRFLLCRDGDAGGGLMAGLSTGNAKAALAERGDDLYETPPVAVEALLSVENLPSHLWEPACGPGSIVNALRRAGHTVMAARTANAALIS